MKKIFTKENVAIAITVAIMMLIGAFAEIGIATAFHVQIFGMDYATYARTFFTQYVWMIPVVIGCYIGCIVMSTRIVKDLWKEISKYYVENQETK